MFSQRARRLAVTGVALVAVAGMLVGCSDDGTGTTPGGPSTDVSSGGPVPDVISSYPSDTWDVTISSVAADKSVMRPMQEWFMDEVERRTAGAIQFHRTTAAEICAASDQYACIQSGNAGLLVQAPNYQPNIFAPAQLPEISFLPAQDNQAAVTSALSELYATNADTKAFFAAKELVPVSVWTAGRMLIGSNQQLSGPADLKGLTMRTAGTIAAPELAAAGVIPTQVTADEAYNAFSTGLVKSAAGAMDFVYAWKLGEVLSNWVDPGVGVYSSFAMFWSQDQWDQFPADVKAVLGDIADDLNSGKLADLYENGYDTHPLDSSAPTHYLGMTEECKAVQQMSQVKSMTRWSDQASADLKALGATDGSGNQTNDQLWVKNATAAGLTNAQGVLDQYESLLTKYSSQFPQYADDPTLACIASFGK